MKTRKTKHVKTSHRKAPKHHKGPGRPMHSISHCSKCGEPHCTCTTHKRGHKKG